MACRLTGSWEIPSSILLGQFGQLLVSRASSTGNLGTGTHFSGNPGKCELSIETPSEGQLGSPGLHLKKQKEGN
jgi:hypothetical protein